MSNAPALQAAIAAHRFGLGEPTLEPLRNDPQGWLLAQVGPALGPAAAARLPNAPWYFQRNLLILIDRLGSWPEGFSLAPYAAHADARVRREAPSAEPSAACRHAREQTIERHRVARCGEHFNREQVEVGFQLAVGDAFGDARDRGSGTVVDRRA